MKPTIGNAEQIAKRRRDELHMSFHIDIRQAMLRNPRITSYNMGRLINMAAVWYAGEQGEIEDWDEFHRGLSGD